MTFSHKFNHNIWRCKRWYDTKDTPSYLGVLLGTKQGVIILTRNIINPAISTKLLVIRAYDTLKRNLPKKTNTTRKQHAYVSHKEGWNSGTKSTHVEPPMITLIKETYNDKLDKDFVKLKLRMNPTSSTLDLYEFKMSLFDHGDPEEFFCLYATST